VDSSVRRAAAVDRSRACSRPTATPGLASRTLRKRKLAKCAHGCNTVRIAQRGIGGGRDRHPTRPREGRVQPSGTARRNGCNPRLGSSLRRGSDARRLGPGTRPPIAPRLADRSLQPRGLAQRPRCSSPVRIDEQSDRGGGPATQTDRKPRRIPGRRTPDLASRPSRGFGEGLRRANPGPGCIRDGVTFAGARSASRRSGGDAQRAYRDSSPCPCLGRTPRGRSPVLA